MNKSYDEVIQKIISNIEKGVMPWKKPWTSDGAPRNFLTQKKYRGFNCFMLLDHDFSTNQWGTFKQINENGGRVNKGAVSYKIFFSSFKEEDVLDENNELVTERTFKGTKCYSVYNLDQTTGLERFIDVDVKRSIVPDEKAEAILADMPKRPRIDFSCSRAFYRPGLDLVGIPRKESFISMPQYYSTLFHELAHSTGHPTRLNRFEELSAEHAKGEIYSREELVAEFTASLLMAEAGIYSLDIEENSSSYISGWLKLIKDDPMALISSANKAQKACDYILNLNESKRENHE